MNFEKPFSFFQPIDDTPRTRVAESNGGAVYSDGWLLTTTAQPRSLVAQPFDPDRLTFHGAPQMIRDGLVRATSNGPAGFSVSSSGVLAVNRPPPVIHQLTWMDRAGRVVGTVGPAAELSEFALSPDEGRVVASLRDVGSLKADLWLFDVHRDERTRLTFQVDTRRPMWALDSRHVYFSRVAATLEMQSLAIGGTGPQPFDNPGGFTHFEDLTRDGRYFVMKSQFGKPAAIWLQRVGAPAERRLLVEGNFGAVQERVSPDGRWLAFTLTRPGGQEIFVQPFDRPGDRIQVSRTGGTGAMWRADSRELYYESNDGLMAVSMTERGGALEVGTPQKLFPLHTQGFVTNQPHNVEVAANGQKFLVSAIVGDSDNVPIDVTLNWTAGLKK